MKSFENYDFNIVAKKYEIGYYWRKVAYRTYA